jgi:chloramphenicol 3-O-phosphotransferase
MSLEASLRDDHNLHCPERTSCSGKSSIAAALQELWPRPLQVTGLDTFLASQSRRFFAIDGRVAAGFSWFPVTVDGQPAFNVVPGPLGLG